MRLSSVRVSQLRDAHKCSKSLFKLNSQWKDSYKALLLSLNVTLVAMANAEIKSSLILSLNRLLSQHIVVSHMHAYEMKWG
jgi:hypothetical protein